MSKRGTGLYDGIVLAAALLCGPPAVAADVAAADRPFTANPAAAYAAATAQRLGLTPEQQALFQAYLEAMRRRPDTGPALPADTLRAMTPGQSLDFIVTQITADLTAARDRQAAFRQFYDALSPDQRSRFDAGAARPPRHGGLAPDVVTHPPPETPNLALPSHLDPDWQIRPTADDVSRVYPSQALRDHIGGVVVLSCMADENGYLTDCVVASEIPEGHGFGNAALEMTAYFRMRPASNYGIPTRATVQIPINFKLGE